MKLRWLGATALVALALGGVFVGQGSTAGPGGWGHVGDGGAPGTKSLNGNVTALYSGRPGELLVGGDFTDAGGNPAADRIASWNGSTWSPVGSASDQITGGVFAIAHAGDKVYAGGTFQNAGGDPNADALAVWDGVAWAPFCTPNVAGQPPFAGNVKALQVVGSTLYVGGDFQNWAGIESADYLVACDLNSGAARPAVADLAHPFSGRVLALTVDSDGVLYAGGRFLNLENLPAADNVAYLAGGAWHAMGSGAGQCGCAIDEFVRSLTAVGTDVYVGTDFKNVAGIAQADNVARWNGSAWTAVGSDAAGGDGWFPASTFIYALTSSGSQIFAAGAFLDAGGDATADNVAVFDSGGWHAVGSNGAGNGPWSGEGNALAVFDGPALYAGGSFTSAGGDTQARSVASIALAPATPVATPTPAAATPVPTPVATPSAMPVPTPTPTPSPADTLRPRITAYHLSRPIFRAAPSGVGFRTAAVPIGAIVSITLSEPGTLRFTIDRSAGGRTVKRKCVKPASSNRARPACKRWVAAKGSYTVKAKKGANRIEMRGRIGGRTLTPGSYRLNVRQTDRAGNRSLTRRTAFRIVR